MPLEPFFELESIANRDPELYQILQKMADTVRGTQVISSGSGDPNGSVSAVPGSQYIQRDFGNGNTLATWVKTGPTPGNQNWVKLQEVNARSQVQDWANTFVDPTQSGFRTTGSVPPTGASSFTYTSTTSSITWYWDGSNGSVPMTIYRADGTTVQNVKGNQTISGLANGTTYYFYPYYDEASGTVRFAIGPNGIGSPTAAFTSRDIVAAQNQNLKSRVPLSPGGMVAVTGGGSGSGGGSAACFSGGTSMETFAGHTIFALNAHPGIALRSEDEEKTIVVAAMHHVQRQWVKLRFSNDSVLIVTPRHALDGVVSAEDITLGTAFTSRSGERVTITAKEIVEHDGHAVDLRCDASPWIWAATKGELILVHNVFKI